MAHEEMQTIRDLDRSLLEEHKHRICVYFADRDDWVGEQREAIIQAFQADPGHTRIVRGGSDIPHAFCISTYFDCSNWVTMLTKNVQTMAKKLRNNVIRGLKVAMSGPRAMIRKPFDGSTDQAVLVAIRSRLRWHYPITFI
jgi:hypothetical protein